MAKTFTAAFAQDPKTLTVVLSAAVGGLNTDSPTNTEQLVSAGPEGAIVTSISALPRDSTTAASLLLFLSKDGGVTQRLIASELIPAHTVDATTSIPVAVFADISETSPIRLEAGDQLYIGTGVASNIVAFAQSTDY